MRIGTRLFLAVGVFALAAPARAGSIPNGNYPGSGTGGSATASVTNNFFGTGLNLDSNAKNFTSGGYIDISFSVVNSSGTKNYAVTEGVTNSTSRPINNYVIMVGVGTGANFHQTAPAGYMFSNSSSSNMGPGTLSSGNQTLTYSGGFIPVGGTGTFTFNMSVPNSTLTHFTLREVASLALVPEPSSIVLAFMGGMGVMVLGWRRARAGQATSR